MAERIPLTDPSLVEREQKAIAELRELYPDGIILGLDTKHRQFGKRLTRLYRSIGYESRRDMLEAWGFGFGESTGGRPRSVDPEEVIAEIARRYEGRPKPKSVKEISEDNPDLAGNIKTLMNASVGLYGQGLVKELADRGILDRTRSASDVTDDDLRAMISALEETYAGAERKWQTIGALREAHPEYQAELDRLARRSELVFGMRTRDLLISRGIIAGGRAKRTIEATEDEVWQAINELGEMALDQPDKSKPKTIAELAKANRKLGPYVQAGKSMGLTDKRPLQLLGILQPTKTLARTDSVRRSSLESMISAYRLAGGHDLVLPGSDEANRLMPGICGIDLEQRVELREMVKAVIDDASKGLSVGDRVSVSIPAHRGFDWENWNDIAFTGADGSEHKFSSYDHRVSEALLAESPSPLMQHAGGTVVSTGVMGGKPFAQIRIRVVGELQAATLAWALRTCGLVDERDVRGGMGWHFRLWQIEHGFASTKDFGFEDGLQDEGEGTTTVSQPVDEPVVRQARPMQVDAIPEQKVEDVAESVPAQKPAPSVPTEDKVDFSIGFAFKPESQQEPGLGAELDLTPEPRPEPEEILGVVTEGAASQVEPKTELAAEPVSSAQEEVVEEPEPAVERESTWSIDPSSQLQLKREGLLADTRPLPEGFALAFADKPGEPFALVDRTERMRRTIEGTLMERNRAQEEAERAERELQAVRTQLVWALQAMIKKRKAEEKAKREAESAREHARSASHAENRQRKSPDFADEILAARGSEQTEELSPHEKRMAELRKKWAEEAARRESAQSVASPSKSKEAETSAAAPAYWHESASSTEKKDPQAEKERIARENAEREKRLEQLRASWQEGPAAKDESPKSAEQGREEASKATPSQGERKPAPQSKQADSGEPAKGKGIGKILLILAVLAAAAIAAILYLNAQNAQNAKQKEEAYESATALMESREYMDAAVAFRTIEDYKDSAALAKKAIRKARKKASKHIKVGKTISLGSYEQDNDASNGPEPIKWIVLDVKDDKALLLSYYGLDARSYNDQKTEDNSWDHSSLKSWMEGPFMSSAFSEGVRIAYLADAPFCLSAEEAEKYLLSSERVSNVVGCIVTAYAATQNTSKDMKNNPLYSAGDTGSWWLRQDLPSAGNKTQYAPIVLSNGTIVKPGQSGSNLLLSEVTRTEFVRPAMYVYLK